MPKESIKWKIIQEKSKDHWLEVEDPGGWYSAIVKWDGCIHYNRYYNTPKSTPNRPEEDGTDYAHICDIDEEITRLQALRQVAIDWFTTHPNGGDWRDTMIYANYGGLAYKNKDVRTDHCNVMLYREGIPDPTKSWDTFYWDKRERKYPNAHVSLGDLDMRVMLHKQSKFEIWLRGVLLNPARILTAESKKEVPEYQTIYTDGNGKPYFNTDAFSRLGKKAIFKHDKFTIELFWEETDNDYQYARLIQPDGNVWLGFSGYGVGNGLEGGKYGYSTQDCIDRLFDLFG